MVKDRLTGQDRVSKCVSTAELQAGVLDMVRKEVELLCRLDHPHVVKLFEYLEDDDKQELMLILEYVPGGSCTEYLKKSTFSLSEGLVARLIYQVLAAVAYCHASGVAHRDVKPEHMMLTQVGLWGQPNCKLIDFGLAAFTASASSGDFVGTPEYMAPEVVSRATADPTKTDIWSIGMSTVELLTGKNPFGKPIEIGSNDPVYAKVRSYHSFRDIENTLEAFRGWTSRTDEARDFVYFSLIKDPWSRPTAQDCIQHPWMQENRDKRASITRDMISSMSGYIEVHLLVKCCLFVIAARTEVPNRERLEAAFVWLDSDCDGEISSQDLAGAMTKGQEWGEWWDTSDLMSLLRGSPSFDPVALVDAADLDASGGLSFTEFAATCLYSKESADTLVQRAFDALDDDRDGQVHAQDVVDLFQEIELSAHGLLPQDQPITKPEWCALFNEAFTQPTYQRKVVVRKKKRGWC
jgi:calcium-dependent protein kinase